MPNLTVRNIPQEVLTKLRALASRERRSLNSELLVVLESGLRTHMEPSHRSREAGISRETQLDLWEGLCGKWKDPRSPAEIIDDLRQSRTPGRDVSL